MKKYHIIFILSIIFLIVLALNFVNIPLNFYSAETTLLKSFNRSGAKVVSTEVYFWGSAESGKYNSFDELKELADNFAKELGITGSSKFTQNIIQNDSLQEIQLSGVLPGRVSGNERLVSINVQLSGKHGSTNENHISVDVMEDLSSTGMSDTRRKIEAVFKKYGITPRINSCITGSFEGKLTYDNMNNICRLIFKEADAVKVEDIRDENLISVSAYSPAIGQYIRVKENRVNLSLAIRYNSYEDKTYLWLATPVITTEY